MLFCLVLSSVLLVGEDPITVIGKGNSSCSSNLAPVTVRGGAVYAFSWEQRVEGTGGAVTAGTPFANLGAWCPRDGAWHPVSTLVVAPTRGESFVERFSFGQWMLNGTAEFRRARLEELRTEYASFGNISLGHGECLEDRTYTFFAPCGCDGWLKARALHEFDCGYQGALWWFDRKDSFVTYRHAIDGRRMLGAKVYAGPSEWGSGSGEVMMEASVDGRTWRKFGGVTPWRSGSFNVPSDLFPCEELLVRLRGGADVSVQVSHYALEAQMDRGEGCFSGSTKFIPVLGQRTSSSVASFAEIKSNPFYDDFGETLASSSSSTSPSIALWSASSGRKVPRRRPLPTAKGSGIELKLAANESEAAQLVVSPKSALADVRVTAAFPLPVEVLRVGYVKVTYPTDGFGIFGDVPDPLPPQDEFPLAVKAGENQPFWVRVKAPKGTKRGVYRGELTVAATMASVGEVERLTVPFSVEVFGFELPDETPCETAFGCTMEKIDPYYRPEWGSPAHRRLAESALSIFAEHRLSPYLPAPLDGFGCRMENGKVIFDWTAWDRAVEDALENRHFNTFLVPIMGLGACSMHSQNEPAFFGRKRGDSGYDELVGGYLAEIERHLVAKGWIDKAYVYPYDEPMPQHYELVKWGFGLMKKYAPRIRRMLPVTKPPVAELGDAANLWCIATYSLNFPATEVRRAAGDGIWWYVCNNPKAPYAADFIDRPTADLRSWLWQTWGENVSGVLIWETLHWDTYGGARGKGVVQDIWLDPMTWCRNGGVATGNGEGRFLYPPQRWRDGETAWKNGLVGSIRLEHLRDGIEDHLYLTMLRRKVKDHPLTKVSPAIYSGVNSFAADPQAMELQRLAIAEALSGSSKVDRCAQVSLFD